MWLEMSCTTKLSDGNSCAGLGNYISSLGDGWESRGRGAYTCERDGNVASSTAYIDHFPILQRLPIEAISQLRNLAIHWILRIRMISSFRFKMGCWTESKLQRDET